MRVTSNSYYNLILANINRNQASLNETRMHIASGKKIQFLSDAPTKLGSLLKHKDLIQKNEQYLQNIKHVMDYLSVVMDALDHGASILATVKSLTVQGIDSLSQDEKKSFAEQIDNYLNEMLDVANTTFKGKYVFAGTSTTSQPFTLSGDRNSVSITANGIGNALRAEIGQFQVEKYNVNGQEAFLDGGNVFDTLIQLREAFRAGDQAAISMGLGQLEEEHNQILASASRAGALLNRLDLLSQQYEVENTTLQEFASHLEDADLYEEALNLQKQEMGLQAALSVAARGMELSLLNYLR